MDFVPHCMECRARGEGLLMHNTKSGIDAEQGAMAVSLAVGDAVGKAQQGWWRHGWGLPERGLMQCRKRLL